MKPAHIIVLFALVLVLPACSKESDPLANLEGSYQIADGCVLTLKKDSASASCDTTSVKASIQVSISEGSINIETLTWTTKESNTTCYDARECTTTYTGSASTGGGGSDGGIGPAFMAGDGFTMPLADQGGAAADKGASTSKDAGGGSSKSSEGGMFTGLAGTWTGEIKAAIACATETIKSGAPKSCKATTAETITYAFDAVASDHEIEVKWYGTPKAGKGTFKVVETKNGVRVGDDFYQRTSGGGSSSPKQDKGAATSDGSL